MLLKLNPSTRSIKIRFFCWIAVIIVILAFFTQQLISGLVFNNNVLELLPKTTANKVNATAEQRFTSAIGNQVVFLISNTDKAQAEQAAQTFYQQISQSAVFEKINFLVSNDEQAWPTFYFPYRLGLLSASQQQLLQTDQEQVIVTNALANLYSPFGAANTNTLAADPYFLFQQYLLNLPKPSSTLMVSDQKLMVQYQGQWYVMITAQMQDNSFSVTNQKQVSAAIANAKQTVQQQIPATQVLMSGTIFYAQAGSAAAEHDIAIIGFGSLIGIILLVWLTFRSVKPLIYTVLSSAVGFIAALVVTHWVFGSIYLFTLIFGASLIGIAVDYAYFYYAEQLMGNTNWTAALGLKRIFSGITLGLFNVVLAYFIIAFTPFPGLKQLAVFSITGLVTAYLTVVCIFPLLLKPRTTNFTPFMLKLSASYLAYWRKFSIKQIVLIYLAVAVVLVIGLSRITINDDVRVLQRMPAALQDNDKNVKNIIGSHIGTTFYVVTGVSPDETLQHEAVLLAKLNAAFPNINSRYVAVSSYVPAVAQQQANYNLVQQKLIQHNLPAYLHKIGVSAVKAKQIQTTLAQTAFKPLTVDAWQASPISNSLKFLWLGQVDQQYASVVLLSEQLDPATLITIAQGLSFVSYVDKANQVSDIFKQYREKLILVLALIFAVLLVLLVLRYGIRKAALYFLPPLTAAFAGVAALGLFGIPLTLFNVLALILILGISVDYVLFFAETQENYTGTMLAVSLSAVSMALSFGLLALSSTPAIHYFGVTMLSGIVVAFLLSPLAARISEGDQHHAD